MPMSAAGSHTRVAPEDSSISTRVFTSNVRQPPDVASSASKHSVFVNARLADIAPADRRKSRRFIEQNFMLTSPLLYNWLIPRTPAWLLLEIRQLTILDL